MIAVHLNRQLQRAARPPTPGPLRPRRETYHLSTPIGTLTLHADGRETWHDPSPEDELLMEHGDGLALAFTTPEDTPDHTHLATVSVGGTGAVFSRQVVCRGELDDRRGVPALRLVTTVLGQMVGNFQIVGTTARSTLRLVPGRRAVYTDRDRRGTTRRTLYPSTLATLLLYQLTTPEAQAALLAALPVWYPAWGAAAVATAQRHSGWDVLLRLALAVPQLPAGADLWAALLQLAEQPANLRDDDEMARHAFIDDLRLETWHPALRPHVRASATWRRGRPGVRWDTVTYPQRVLRMGEPLELAHDPAEFDVRDRDGRVPRHRRAEAAREEMHHHGIHAVPRARAGWGVAWASCIFTDQHGDAHPTLMAALTAHERRRWTT